MVNLGRLFFNPRANTKRIRWMKWFGAEYFYRNYLFEMTTLLSKANQTYIFGQPHQVDRFTYVRDIKIEPMFPSYFTQQASQ